MEHKGNLLIRDLWNNSNDIFHGMRVVNTDDKYHLANTPDKCFQEAGRGQRKMYLEACLQQCQHLSPFVASVVRIMGVDVGAN